MKPRLSITLRRRGGDRAHIALLPILAPTSVFDGLDADHGRAAP